MVGSTGTGRSATYDGGREVATAAGAKNPRPATRKGNGAQVCKPRGRTVSRVLFGSEDPDGHLSGMVVADHLKQPTRGYPFPGDGAGRTSPPIWPCSDWGLPCH